MNSLISFNDEKNKLAEYESYTMSEVARLIGDQFAGRNTIYKYLREKGVLTETNFLRSEYVDKGLFLMETSTGYNYSFRKLYFTIRVTKEGIQFIRQLIDDNCLYIFIDE
jgi:phage antirepressor YoqD-like protein